MRFYIKQEEAKPSPAFLSDTIHYYVHAVKHPGARKKRPGRWKFLVPSCRMNLIDAGSHRRLGRASGIPTGETMTPKLRLLTVAIFAAAMAWVESAVVFYLRVLVDRLQPYQPVPLPIFGGLGEAELIREASTLVMLLAVGGLAGRNGRTRLAFSLFAFGVWDILYYLFLVPLTGWPNSLLDWDILFLIPVPWWAPVIAPVSIAGLLALGGAVVALKDQTDRPLRVGWPGWVPGAAGALLALYSFTAETLPAAGRGAECARQTLPVNFPWMVFLGGLFLMAIPMLHILRRALLPAGKRAVQS
jgi:hypothetical protein